MKISSDLSKISIIFSITAISIIFINLYLFPSLLINAQPVQDGGINFLQTALRKGVIALIYPDGGFFPLFQRVLSLFAYYALPLRLYPLGINILAAFVVALSCASLTCRVWESFIPPLQLRASLAILFGCWPDYESHLIENVGIYLYLPICTLLLSATQIRKDYFHWLWIPLIFLMSISKPMIAGVGLAAAYLYFVSYSKGSINRNNRFLSFAVILGCAIQALYSLIYNQINSIRHLYSPLEIADGMLEAIYKLPVGSTQISYGDKPFKIAITVLAWIFLVYLVTLLVKNLKTLKDEYSKIQIQILVSLSIVFTASLFISKLFPGYVTSYDIGYLIEIDRFSFIYVSSFILIYVGLIASNFNSCILKHVSAQNILIIIIGILIANNIFIAKDLPEQNRWSDWGLFSNLYLKNGGKDFTAPIDSIGPPKSHWLLTLGPQFLNASNPYGLNQTKIKITGDNSYVVALQTQSDRPKKMYLFISKDELIGGDESLLLEYSTSGFKPIAISPLASSNPKYLYFLVDNITGSSISFKFIQAKSNEAIHINNFLVVK